MELFKSFLKEEDGVTIIEYALLAALIAAALVATLGTTRAAIATLLGRINTALAA